MRTRLHLPSLTAVITLLVALATTGATFITITARPGDGPRRRNAAVRVIRGGIQRADSPEAITHDAEHHDPVAAPSAEGLAAPLAAQLESATARQSRDAARIHAFPPGVIDRAFDTAGDARPSAAVIPSAVVLLRSAVSRPTLGRAPPAF